MLWELTVQLRAIAMHRTDCWESFRTDRLGCVRNMTDRITNFIDIETAAKQFQDAIIDAYNENCPLTVRRNNRNVSWWNQDRRREGGKCTDCLMRQRSQGNGLTTKEL